MPSRSARVQKENLFQKDVSLARLYANTFPNVLTVCMLTDMGQLEASPRSELCNLVGVQCNLHGVQQSNLHCHHAGMSEHTRTCTRTSEKMTLLLLTDGRQRRACDRHVLCCPGGAQ